MSWSSITSDEVLSEFTPTERTIIETISGSTTALDSILDRAVNSARGSMLAGGNRLSAAGTVPDQIRPEIIAIARWRWITSLPKSGMALATDARKDAHREAMDLLKEIARGDLKVELPATAIDAATPDNAIEVASANDRRATTSKLDGLL